MTAQNRLLRHSLVMIAATGTGHVGNYLYHMITGRMLSDNEYGLLMALFGAVNVFLLPMGALHLALSRGVARQGQAVPLFRIWLRRMGLGGGLLLGIGWALSPWIQARLGFARLAPVLLAVSIPVMNLFLVLTGAGLQGLQRFSWLAMRGGVLFGIRALLVGLCLGFGFRAAGWALLAHLLGMAAALGFSLWGVRNSEPAPPASAPAAAPPVSRDALFALPLLAAFAVLMSCDVLLVRTWFSRAVSGQFAQAATLGRMILWLPLPIATAMFPKVVRAGKSSSEHRKTALHAVGYTLMLTGATLAGAWILGPLGFRLVYGIQEVPDLQLKWLRQVALAMVPLAPLHVWMHYELARGSIRRLSPILIGAGVFVTLCSFRHAEVMQIIQALQIANAAALAGSVLMVWRGFRR